MLSLKQTCVLYYKLLTTLYIDEEVQNAPVIFWNSSK